MKGPNFQVYWGVSQNVRPHKSTSSREVYIYVYPHMKRAQTYIVKIPLCGENRDLLLKYTTFSWLQLSRERWSSKKPWCFKDQVPQEVFRHHLPLPMRSPGFCNPFGGRTINDVLVSNFGESYHIFPTVTLESDKKSSAKRKINFVRGKTILVTFTP